MKINLKPVFVSFEEAFFRRLPTLDEVKRRAEKILKEFQANISEDVIVLEPFILTSPEGIEDLKKELTRDVDAVIVWRVGGMAHRLIASVGLLGVPFIMLGSGVLNHDIVAYLRHRGSEAYAPFDYRDLNKLIRYLKVRKAIRSSRILIVSSMELPSFSAISSAYDLDKMKTKFGIESTLVPSEQLFNVYKTIGSSDEVRSLASKLMDSALSVKVDRTDVERAVQLYIAIKRMMERYRANTVTINCAEPIFFKYKVTPCLAFSLLKDEGVPASCEADLSALLAMMILMWLTDKPTFMGNLWLHDEERNLVRFSHDVPPLKVKGFKEEKLPYEIFDFHDQKYGASFYVHVELNKPVTFARVHASLNKMLVSTGTVVESYEGIACRQTLEIRVKNARRLMKRVANYGHHFSLVYGDYSSDLEELCEILGLSPEIV